MNRETIIENIRTACCCDECQAEEYLDTELRHLRELRDVGDLRQDDLEAACSGLGLEYDFMVYFLAALAI